MALAGVQGPGLLPGPPACEGRRWANRARAPRPAWLGLARHGTARHGTARCGTVRHGAGGVRDAGLGRAAPAGAGAPSQSRPACRARPASPFLAARSPGWRAEGGAPGPPCPARRRHWPKDGLVWPMASQQTHQPIRPPERAAAAEQRPAHRGPCRLRQGGRWRWRARLGPQGAGGGQEDGFLTACWAHCGMRRRAPAWFCHGHGNGAAGLPPCRALPRGSGAGAAHAAHAAGRGGGVQGARRLIAAPALRPAPPT